MDLEQSTKSRIGVLVKSPEIMATLESYDAAMVGRKRRLRGRATYATELRLFAARLGADATLADVTPECLDRYQMTIEHLAASTIGKKLSAIRSWCRWCLKKRLRTDDPTVDLVWPKRPKRLPRPLKTEELQQLESILARHPPVLNVKARRLWLRNRRIVLLLLYTGLRRAEVAGLCWEDVYLAEQLLIVREQTAKGGTERTVPLHPRVIEELQRTSVSERRGAVAGHKDGRCLSHKSLGEIFERWLNDAGLRISAHRLRHTCATELLRSGAGLRDVHATLGHADIHTTEGYVALLPEQQRAAVRRLPDRFG